MLTEKNHSPTEKHAVITE